MKTSILIKVLVMVLLVSVTISASGCSASVGTRSTTSKKVPPGQVKKAAGEKSAKRFAPGQNK